MAQPVAFRFTLILPTLRGAKLRNLLVLTLPMACRLLNFLQPPPLTLPLKSMFLRDKLRPKGPLSPTPISITLCAGSSHV